MVTQDVTTCIMRDSYIYAGSAKVKGKNAVHGYLIQSLAW